MARVFVTRRFQKSFQARVRKALEEIRTNPRVGKALTGPLTGEFSLRVGAYGIVYTHEPAEDPIWLDTGRHRRDVYRRRRAR